jgi:hypothetical protein
MSDRRVPGNNLTTTLHEKNSTIIVYHSFISVASKGGWSDNRVEQWRRQLAEEWICKCHRTNY